MSVNRIALGIAAVLALVAVLLGRGGDEGAGEAAQGTKPEAVPDKIAKQVQLTPVATRLERPVALVASPDGTGRLFIVEQHVARIRILENGKVRETPFLDMKGRVSKGNEQGLLGLAFHPEFKTNGRFFVNWTDTERTTHVTELRVSKKDANVADPASEKDLLTVDQPYSNHNGGHLVFDPEGRLVIGLGDGGAANDPHGYGQDPKALLGKMLRLDVDTAGAKPEIWLSGVRNPWRYAYDRKTGDLYIGDVGQDRWEEIDVVPAGTTGGNLGWNVMEGFHCFKRRKCDAKKYLAPAVEFDHGEGCSVTGGAVYRGKELPDLDGVYFYADFCTAIVRSFRWTNGKVSDHWEWRPALDPKNKLAQISSFGEDEDGELYLVSLDGTIYRLGKR